MCLLLTQPNDARGWLFQKGSSPTQTIFLEFYAKFFLRILLTRDKETSGDFSIN